MSTERKTGFAIGSANFIGGVSVSIVAIRILKAPTQSNAIRFAGSF